MSHVIVIEPDEKCAREITGELMAINPELAVFRYKSMSEFTAEIDSKRKPPTETFQVEGEKPDASAAPTTFDFKKIVLIVVDADSNKSVPLPLWAKLMKFFDAQDPNKLRTRLIFTGFEEHNHDKLVEKYIHHKVFNLVIKPFDMFLLRQTLQLALAKDGAVQPTDIYSHQGENKIEVIKEIEIEVLTELGFRTRSSREIEFHKSARYFGEAFKSTNGNSIFAYAYYSKKPENEGDKFVCSFSFLGIPKEQLATIRRLINADKSKQKLPFYETKQTQSTYSAIIVSRDVDLTKQLSGLIEDRFLNVKPSAVRTIDQLRQRLAPDNQKDMGNLSRALETTAEVEWIYRPETGKLVALVEPAGEQKKPITKFFSAITADMVNKTGLEDWFNDADRPRFRSSLQANKLDPKQVWEIQGPAGEISYLKCLGVKDLQDENKKPLKALRIQELSAKEITEYLNSKEKWAPVRMVFYDGRIADLEKLSALREIIKRLGGPNAKLFLLTPESVTQYDHIKFAKNVDDILQTPMDFFYYTRKIKMHCEDVAVKNPDDGARYGIEMRTGIKTALPVKMTVISEVHLSLMYHRELKAGDIRRFILYIPNEANMPEVHGVCLHAEEQESGDYRCDFLLFGLHDHQLKYLRKWIKDKYVETKKAG